MVAINFLTTLRAIRCISNYHDNVINDLLLDWSNIMCKHMGELYAVQTMLQLKLQLGRSDTNTTTDMPFRVVRAIKNAVTGTRVITTH